MSSQPRDIPVTYSPVPVELVRPVRDRVLRIGDPAGSSHFPTDDQPDTVHFGAHAGATLVGVATICRQPLDEIADASPWRIRGVAVLPDYQGRRIGARLLDLCIGHVRAQEPGVAVWCSAREPAWAFYDRYGFEPAGPTYSLPGREELVLQRWIYR